MLLYSLNLSLSWNASFVQKLLLTTVSARVFSGLSWGAAKFLLCHFAAPALQVAEEPPVEEEE